MDNQRDLLVNWNYFYQNKSMDEIIRQSLFLTMELEDTKLKAQEQLKNKDEQITQLKDLLNTAINERNEAQENFQKLFLENLLLQQQLQQCENSNIEDEPKKEIHSNNGISSSDCDESIVSSPQIELPVVVDRELPEKGKFLEAVMKAGPLLQTLLLAGPLPQWRHPPPPLDTYQIPPPPVVIPSLLNNKSCGKVNRKRGLSQEGSDSSSIDFKYQRIVLH